MKKALKQAFFMGKTSESAGKTGALHVLTRLLPVRIARFPL
jgi:hypothetical protein